MIAQLLNRDFMQSAATLIAKDLEVATKSDGRRGGAPHISDGVDDEDLVAAGLALRSAIEEELDGGKEKLDKPSREHSQGDSQEERNTEKSYEDFVYMPRSRTISLLQSSLELWLTEHAPQHVSHEPPPDDRRGGGQEIAVTGAYMPDFPLEESDDRRWFGRFETSRPKVFSDPRWVSAVFAMAWRKAVGQHPFNPEPAVLAEELRPNVRFIVMGDWATGIDRALKVRDQIAHELERGLERGLQQQVVHLGDVYYSGWEHEYESRLLEPWPVPHDQRELIGSWTLNGNHDMYSGGHGYFDTCLKDKRFASQEQSSWFCMDTPGWRIIGLDTAWKDSDLQEPQPQQVVEWIESAGKRRIMLLSHHQLLSAYSQGIPILGQRLAPVLSNRGIDAWFWGHEHRCVLYEPTGGLKHGRCVGHGGVPEYMPRTEKDPYKPPSVWEFRGRKPKLGQPWNTFGFAVLDFDGPNVDVRYIDEDGNCVKRERL